MPQPNFFISIRICNPAILEKIKEVQKHIVSKQSNLNYAVVSSLTAHITLNLLSLTKDDIEKAQHCFSECSSAIKELVKSPLILSVLGVKNFDNKVIYADVTKNEHYDLVKQFYDHFSIAMKDFEYIEWGFNPHITIMKLNKLKGQLRKKVRKIKPEFYSDFGELDFGVEHPSSIQLLSMMEKDESGYYKCYGEINLDKEE